MYVPLLYEGRHPTDGTRVQRSWGKHGSWRCLIQWAGHQKGEVRGGKVSGSCQTSRRPGH